MSPERQLGATASRVAALAKGNDKAGQVDRAVTKKAEQQVREMVFDLNRAPADLEILRECAELGLVSPQELAAEEARAAAESPIAWAESPRPTGGGASSAMSDVDLDAMLEEEMQQQREREAANPKAPLPFGLSAPGRKAKMAQEQGEWCDPRGPQSGFPSFLPRPQNERSADRPSHNLVCAHREDLESMISKVADEFAAKERATLTAAEAEAEALIASESGFGKTNARVAATNEGVFGNRELV